MESDIVFDSSRERRWAMSARDSSGDSPLGSSEGRAGGDVPEDSRRDVNQAGNALNDGAAPQIVSPLAPAWLPADLADALSAPASGNHSDVIAEAFCQGGPLDELPPGPALAAFLAAALTAASDPRPAAGPATESSDSPPAAGTVADSAEPCPTAGPGPENSDPRPAAGAPSESTEPRPGAGPAAEGAEPLAGTGGVPGLARCGDNALLGLIRGWRRVASQAAAAELAAVAEFTARRQAEAKSAGEWDSSAVGAADTEIGAALTLTSRSTQLLIERATMLQELPATAEALAAGRIDMPKALVFITGLSGQDPELARMIETQLIDRAPAQTTGQLRAAVNRALIAADPEAAERRREAEEKQGRIERQPEGSGTTASLAGRYLPVPATVAAWNNITAVARELRRSGASGTLDELRVQVYLALLSGQAVGGLTADSNDPAKGSNLGGEDRGADESGDRTGANRASDGTGENHADDDVQPEARTETPDADLAEQLVPSGPASRATDDARTPAGSPATGTSSPGGLTGSVNLTVPLVTLLGLAESPGGLGGFGPITAFTARDLAVRALDAPAVRWCVTVADETGQPVAHGCATRKRRSRQDPGWAFTISVSALAGDDCAHTRARAAITGRLHCSGTSCRSATSAAPRPAAGTPRTAATTTTPSRTTRAAVPASATSARSAVTITGSNSPKVGGWSNRRPGSSSG